MLVAEVGVCNGCNTTTCADGDVLCSRWRTAGTRMVRVDLDEPEDCMIDTPTDLATGWTWEQSEGLLSAALQLLEATESWQDAYLDSQRTLDPAAKRMDGTQDEELSEQVINMQQLLVSMLSVPAGMIEPQITHQMVTDALAAVSLQMSREARDVWSETVQQEPPAWMGSSNYNANDDPDLIPTANEVDRYLSNHPELAGPVIAPE